MFKIFLYCIGSYVLGICTAFFFQWKHDRNDKNRVGTDSNVIQQVGKGIEDSGTAIGQCQDTVSELKRILSDVEARERTLSENK